MFLFYELVLMRISLNDNSISPDRYSLLNMQSINSTYSSSLKLDSYDGYNGRMLNLSYNSTKSNLKNMLTKNSGFLDMFNPLVTTQEKQFLQVDHNDGDRNGTDASWMQYNMLIYTVLNNMYIVLHNVTFSDYNSTSDNFNLNYLLNNMIDTFNYDMLPSEHLMVGSIMKSITGIKVVIYILVGLYFLNLGLTIISSVICIMKMYRRYSRIYESIEMIRLDTVEKKSEILLEVSKMLEKGRLKHLQIRDLGTKQMKKLKVNKASHINMSVKAKALNQMKRNKSESSNVSDNRTYCFQLLSSILMLIGLYLTIMTLILIRLTLYTFSNNNLASLYNKQESIVDTMGTIQKYRTTLLASVILKDRIGASKVKKYLNEYLEAENRNSSVFGSKISSLTQNLDFGSIGQDATTGLLNLYSSSLCEVVPELLGFHFACKAMDLGVPQKGLIQAYYSIKTMMDYLSASILDDLPASSILNNNNYISFEIAYQQIYLVSNDYLLKFVYKSLMDFTNFLIWRLNVMTIANIVVIVVMYTVISVLTFEYLFHIKDYMTFIFNIVPFDGVLDNQRVRVVFIMLFQLDKQYFS